MSAYLQHGGRRIQSEISKLIGKEVLVITVNGRKYRGTLLDFDYSSFNTMLSNVKDEEATIPMLIIHGNMIAEIRAEHVSSFDAGEFAKYVVEKLGLRPDAVRVYSDANVVVIYNSIRVTEHGVEGSGTLAAKVNYVFREYMERKKRGEKLS